MDHQLRQRLDIAAGGDVAGHLLIVDDMGYDLPGGREALALPGALTYAFIPRTPGTPLRAASSTLASPFWAIAAMPSLAASPAVNSAMPAGCVTASGGENTCPRVRLVMVTS